MKVPLKILCLLTTTATHVHSKTKFNQKLQVSKHISSSSEDLSALFESEKAIAREMLKVEEGDRSEVVREFLGSLDYLSSFDSVSGLSYVQHPINAFHLLKRTSGDTFRKLKAKFTHLRIPERKDFAAGATFGVLNLQILHELEVKDVAQGLLIDPVSGTRFQSFSPLTVSDIILIGDRAVKIWQINAAVDWLEHALEREKDESENDGEETTRISKLEARIEQTKRLHDRYILDQGFMTTVKPKNEDICVVHTNTVLYDKHLQRSDPRYARHKAHYDVFQYETKLFENLSRIQNEQQFDLKKEKTLPFKLTYFLNGVMKKLCRGEDKSLRPIEHDSHLRCLLLHRSDPFLRLGPFKYETLHAEPHVGLFHNFTTLSETSTLQTLARGNMKSTPLKVQQMQEDYTRLRTSKVMYMNESVPVAKKLSDRINLAMRFNVYGDKYAAENYQIMNYGIGGSITPHLDATGSLEPAHYNSLTSKGGDRLNTFMLYLTSVSAGGRTVFPQIGLSVKPVQGSALFWFNLDSKSAYDTRNFHIGCPVLHGHKWITNKWVKEFSQWKTYPCFTDGRSYGPFKN